MTKDAINISYTIATFFGIVFLSLGLCKKKNPNGPMGSKPLFFRCVVHLGKPDRTRPLRSHFLVTLELFFLTEIKLVKLEKITPIIGKKYLFSPHLIIFFRASLPLNFPGCKCDQNLKVRICLVKVRRNGETIHYMVHFIYIYSYLNVNGIFTYI